MKRQTRRILITTLLVALAVPAGVRARDSGGPPGDAAGRSEELRAAMQDYFGNRLRKTLSLSDGQMEHILPRIQSFEEQKRLRQRELMTTVRDLRRGLDQGAEDARLLELLAEIDRLERAKWEGERALIDEVSEVLSARQQVQLRFFLQQFRRHMQDKISELRGGEGQRRQPRRGPRRDMP